MLGEQHRAGRGVRLEQLGDPPRHVEAGPLVVEPDRLVAELLLGRAARPSGADVSAMTASGCVWSTCGAGTKACSSVSIDGRGWSGPTAQRSEVVDHRRVVHLLPFAQRQQLVEAQDGKAALA